MSINPYESPKSDANPLAGQISRSQSKFKFPYESARLRASITVLLLAINVIISLISIPQALSQASMAERIAAGQFVAPEEAEANDVRTQLLGLVQLTTIIANYISFMMWMHRAHRNLPALGAEGLEYTPGWAVGAWFVPFLNLWRPYQIAAEIWKASDPNVDSAAGSRRWKQSATSPLLGLWWAGWIAMCILGQIAFRLTLEVETAQDLANGSYADFLSDVVAIPAALLAIQVVRLTTRRQEDRYARLAMMPPRPEAETGPTFNFN